MGSYSKYIKLRLDNAEKFTGEKREDIIKRWLTYFEGHDELISALEDAKDLQDMNDQLKEFEHHLDFDLYWMRHFIKAISKLDKTYYELRSAIHTVFTLNSEHRLRELQLSLPDEHRIYDESESITKIKEASNGSKGYLFLGELIEYKGRVSLKHLRSVFFQYKKLKWTRNLSRFILRIFWGLIVFTLIIGGSVNLLPLSVGIVCSIILWFLQKYIAQPWLQKKLNEKHRLDLITLVKELYLARWEVLVALEEAKFSLNKTQDNFKELADVKISV